MRLRLFAPALAAAGAPPAVLLDAPHGVPLSQAIWLSGKVPPLPLCGGLGACGRCRVRFLQDVPPALPAEAALLHPADLAAGWRLACRRNVPDSLEELDLELPQDALPAPRTDTAEGVSARGLPALSLAVDLGTTSLCWRALDGQGEARGQGKTLNPQAGAGADIISRLTVARRPEGRARLAGLARDALRDVVDGLRRSGAGRVRRICLAANTAMTDIFLDRDVSGLCAAPYRLTHAGDGTFRLPGLPPVYVPPLPAPFVGGDVSAGLATLLAANAPRPLLLADLGTNAELALLLPDDGLWLTSAPLGPALEGIGPQCGQLAGTDVLTLFRLTPHGLAAFFPDGQAADGRRRARGISATGYLSLLALLRRLGVLDGEGRFAPRPAMPLARRLADTVTEGTAPAGTRLPLPDGLWLAAADVEILLQVKAAFAVALSALLKEAGCAPAEVAAFCLAGALGACAHPEDLETLGFAQPPLIRRISPVGNAALDGAALLLQRPELRADLARLCAGAHVLNLAGSPDFQRDYMRQMRFGD